MAKEKKKHRKSEERVEIEKSGIADHIWKEKGNHLLLWEEVKAYMGDLHWRMRYLKVAANMLGYRDLLSRSSIEMNSKMQPIMKNARWK